MDNSIFGEILDIEAKFQELLALITIMKDAVENNDDTSYLLGYVQIIQEQMDKYSEQLAEYNQKVGQIIIHSQEQEAI